MTPEQKQALADDGYVVLPGVLDEEECKKMRDGMWDHVEYLLPDVSRDDQSTWRSVPERLAPKHGMLYQNHHFGLCQAAFDVRQNPKSAKAFEEIWGTKALTSSVDGVAFGLAPEVTGIGYEYWGWLHLDQSLTRNKFECVQGWITGEQVGQGDATLRVLKGSHKFHEEFATVFGKKVCGDDNASARRKKRSDWYKFSDEEIQWYRSKGCEVVDIICPAGSQVLWDSRVVHSGKAPTHGRPCARNRYVVYTSYLPQCKMNGTKAAKKRKAVIEGRMTNHWADARRLFPASTPQLQPYKKPKLTKRGAELFGWSDVSVRTCPFVEEHATPAEMMMEAATEAPAAAAAAPAEEKYK